MLFELAGAFWIDAFQPVHLHLSHLKNLIPVESEDILSYILYQQQLVPARYSWQVQWEFIN